jgi:hypothetical protein
MEITTPVGAPQNLGTLAGRKAFHPNSLRPLLAPSAATSAPRVVFSAPMWPANLADLGTVTVIRGTGYWGS